MALHINTLVTTFKHESIYVQGFHYINNKNNKIPGMLSLINGNTSPLSQLTSLRSKEVLVRYMIQARLATIHAWNLVSISILEGQ